MSGSTDFVIKDAKWNIDGLMAEDGFMPALPSPCLHDGLCSVQEGCPCALGNWYCSRICQCDGTCMYYYPVYMYKTDLVEYRQKKMERMQMQDSL